MQTVRFGVIGIGNIGTAHVNCLGTGKIQGAVLTAACDISAARRAYVEETYGIPTFADYREMLDAGLVDAVHIAVPHPLHAMMAMEALKRGIHVLLEKPADISVSRVQKLNAVAAKSGCVFGMMFNQRTNRLFGKAREIVRSGQLGELKRTVWIITNWYRTQQYYDSGTWRATWSGEGGGVLLNQAPHNLDLWQWICGMPTAVTAFCDVGKYHHIAVEDDVTILTRYANGATGTFITSTGEYPGTNRLEIAGDRGKLVLENGVLKWWKLEEPERRLCFTSSENAPEPPMTLTEWKPTEKETAHAGILQNFTNAILHDEPMLAPGCDGIYELTISNAAYLSAWTGNREIQLPFDTDLFDRLLAERAAQETAQRPLTDTAHDGQYVDRWQVRW